MADELATHDAGVGGSLEQLREKRQKLPETYALESSNSLYQKQIASLRATVFEAVPPADLQKCLRAMVSMTTNGSRSAAHACKVLHDWYKLAYETEQAVARAETAEEDLERLKADLAEYGFIFVGARAGGHLPAMHAAPGSPAAGWVARAALKAADPEPDNPTEL